MSCKNLCAQHTSTTGTMALNGEKKMTLSISKYRSMEFLKIDHFSQILDMKLSFMNYSEFLM